MLDKSYSVTGLRYSRLKPLVTLSTVLFQKFARTTIRNFQTHLSSLPMWNMGCLRGENMFCLPISPSCGFRWLQSNGCLWLICYTPGLKGSTPHTDPPRHLTATPSKKAVFNTPAVAHICTTKLVVCLLIYLVVCWLIYWWGTLVP